ncbi:hypothetical protein SAMN00790413_04096 [Deinococcus hopiensis KR-140]|uniref:Uncharacterized protein n=1 Tax=Deinococcus hopiensis KR-140 TaxID=695939 RepID=A0A1W1UND9_9DEIO|nr:hypothetical protein SAMN00790413_04096 [Deinococcus hopiensis KR-140]
MIQALECLRSTVRCILTAPSLAVTVRPATLTDVEGLARVCRAAWRDTDESVCAAADVEAVLGGYDKLGRFAAARHT